MKAPPLLTRREFAAGIAGLLLSARGQTSPAEAPGARRLRAAVIGHTGHGDYGHGLDLIFQGLEGLEVVAVADADETGRRAAIGRLGQVRAYADYREMLAREKPDVVSVAPRWTDQHAAMGLAALRAGAHVYMEKPISHSLVEADALLAAAASSERRIAVAHQMRMAPSVRRLRQAVGEGFLGELLEVRAFGKQDHRAGGEDMIVLGTHAFDLVRLFAGDPLWCAARVLQNGRDIQPADARAGTESVGPLAGDEIEAEFALPQGVVARFTSRGRLRAREGTWYLELVGSRRRARLLLGFDPPVYVCENTAWTETGRTEQWQRWPDDPGLREPPGQQAGANRRVVLDWLAAIREGRDPVCNGLAALQALEMVVAVYRAALEGRRVPLPLTERRHPLGGDA